MSDIKVGIFGAWRGANFIYPLQNVEGMRLWAVCDNRDDRIEEFLKESGRDVIVTHTFEELLDSGIDAIILTNFFNEHAKYAIRALNKGISVMSDCTAAVTMKECCELCDAAEKSNAIYMLGENYPFMPNNREAKRLYTEGKLGKFLYGEGEYNHAEKTEVLRHLTPGEYHWRAWMPRTYYITHSLDPLMYVSDEVPVTVNARAVHSKELEKIDFRKNCDALAMLFLTTDKGSLFRVGGCAFIPSPGRYRFVGEYASFEWGSPLLGGQVYKEYFSWHMPEGEENVLHYNVDPEKTPLDKIANKAQHWGGDFWVIKEWEECIREGKQPYFDVYKGCTMSAAAILGWKSCLNDGATYHIPDFRNKADRDRYRDDDDTPFPDFNTGKGATLPPAMPYTPSEE